MHTGVRSPRDGEAVTRKSMDKIHVKIAIKLNRNHALSIADLTALKPRIERGIAAFLPDSIAVDTITVTSIKDPGRRDQGAQQNEESAARGVSAGAEVLQAHYQ